MINLAQKIFIVGVVFEGNNSIYDYISCFGNYRPGSTVIVDSPRSGLTRVKVFGVKPYLGNKHRDMYKKYKPIISMEHQFAVEVMKFKEDLVAIETQEVRRQQELADLIRATALREENLRKEEKRRKDFLKADLRVEVDRLRNMIQTLEHRIVAL